MSWFRRGHGQKPDYTALEIQTSASTLPIPIVYGRNKIAGNILWYANFQAVAGGGGKGSGKGGLTRRRRRRPVLYLQGRPDHRRLRRADQRLWHRLQRSVDLFSFPARARQLQRHDAAGRLAISRGDISSERARLPGHRLCLGRRLQPRRRRGDRQPQFRGHRHSRRQRRERRGRRPGAGHLRLSDQRAIWLRLQPGLDQFLGAVRLERRQPADLLQLDRPVASRRP